MVTVGLRERKKARTRQLIADTAARLFAERGYERVAVSDVAREAEVAEQTLYNYFPTKEQLVTDRDEQIQDRLCSLIRARPPGVARLYRIALAGVFQIIIAEAGRRTLEGQTQAQIADELHPVVKSVLDELDRWLSASGLPRGLPSENRKRARGKD